jgi:hypothetical protein
MTSSLAASTPKPTRDETLVKALVRAHRRRRKIESGRAKSITDLAEQEGVTDAYVCRLLPLTCLAPDIVEAILDGRQPKGLRLAEVLGNGPLAWEQQRSAWGCAPILRRRVFWTIAIAALPCLRDLWPARRSGSFKRAESLATPPSNGDSLVTCGRAGWRAITAAPSPTLRVKWPWRRSEPA